jgi:virginiamycin B lyase
MWATVAFGATAHASPPVITEHVIAGAGPGRVHVKSTDGTVWFTRANSSFLSKLDPTTGIVSDIAIPDLEGRFISDVTEGPDGAMWFTTLNGFSSEEEPRVGRIDNDGTVSQFVLREAGYMAGDPSFITAGPDGGIWVTSLNTEVPIYRLSTDGLVTATYSSPPGGGGPWHIAPGPDGAMWISSPVGGGLDGNSLIRLTTTGVASRVLLKVGSTVFGEVFPQDLVAGADGAMWFAMPRAENIGRVTLDGAVTYLRVPGGYNSASVAAGPDGAVWFSSNRRQDSNGPVVQIGRATSSGEVAMYPTSVANSITWDISTGVANDLWATASGASNRLIHIELAGPPADVTAPTATLTTPSSAAQYSLNQTVVADFACADEADGSGIASCVADVDGTPVAAAGAVPTGSAGSHTFTVTATDNVPHVTTLTHTYAVLAGSTSQAASGGATVTTDPGDVGASTDVPIQTAVGVPVGVDGTLTIALHDASGDSPAGYRFFGEEVQLSGPVASSSAPYEISFSVDSSLLGDVAPADLQVFRNGVVVSGCRDATAALPDPCVASRAVGPGGDAIVTVRTSTFSTWNLGAVRYSVSPLGAPILAPPRVNTATAGASISLRFSLGGSHGLDVFAADYPRSAAYACGIPAPSSSTGTPTSGALTFDRRSGMYTYTWKTTKTMKGCRQVVLRFRDGSARSALFNLK